MGAERAGLDGGDRDTKRLDLFAQGFGNPFQREFAAVIHPKARESGQSAHRGNVQDVPAATLAHERQHGLDHGHGTEHVNVELMAEVVQRRLFDQPFMAVTGVIDQDIDSAHGAFDFRDHTCHGGAVGDVQQTSERIAGFQLLKVFARCFVTQRADDAVAGGQQGGGQGLAKSGADAGDQPGFLRVLSLVFDRHDDSSVGAEKSSGFLRDGQ